MNKQEVQKILRAWDECCELKTEFMSDINVLSEGWIERIELCCEKWNSNLDDIIDILGDWAADYSATWTNFLCQEEDNEVIGYEIVYQNYLCQQVDVTTTTSTTIVTTTTTVDPDLEEWTITYSDYLCQQVDDPSVTTTTTIGEKSAVIGFSALWSDFLCGLEDNPLIVTTTTTISETTTTSTTVDPEDVEFMASWTDFQCELEDNPLLTTTTSTTTINEDDVEWIIIYSDYLCQQTDVTTTSTTSTTSTTILIPVTTTTTTTSDSCPVTKTGNTEYGTEYNINLGSTIGKVTLTIDAESAPDRFVVEWNGSEVIDTGYRGDSSYQTVLYQSLILLGEPVALIEGTGAGTFTFNKTTSNPIATVKVYAPLEETDWSFTLSCPVASPLVTTTTTTIGVEIFAEWTNYICKTEDDGNTTTTSTTTTTAPVVTTTTSIRENSISCGETASGGTAYPLEVWITDMGASTGYVTLTYDMNAQPDKFIVEIDGLEVLNTGYRGDSSLQSVLDAKLALYGLPSETIVGNGTGTASFFKASSTTIAVVKIYAPLEETTWSFSVACPDGSTSTTSTSTTTTTSTSTTTVVPTTTTTTTVGILVDSCCMPYLYNWYVTEGTGAASISSSDDWYIPTLEDFNQLIEYHDASATRDVDHFYTGQDQVNSVGTGALTLRSDICGWNPPDSNTNTYGLGFLGSGYRIPSSNPNPFDEFRYLYHTAEIWASDTEGDQPTYALAFQSEDLVTFGAHSSFTQSWSKLTGMSIVLIKDAVGVSDGEIIYYTGNNGNIYRAICINEKYWTLQLRETQYRSLAYIPFEGTNSGYFTSLEWYNLYLTTTGAICAYDNLWDLCDPVLTTTASPTTTTTSAPTTTTTIPATTTSTTTITPYEMCIVYGALYNWYAATDARNIANTGWHVPINDELKTLRDYLGGSSLAGGKMKEIGYTYWGSPNTGASNDSKFNGRGSGYRASLFANFKVNQLIMTITESTIIGKIYGARLDYDSASLTTSLNYTKATGMAVRLIKDSTILSNGEIGTYIGNDGKEYNTICIGTQEWLACNLAETKYRNGDWITGFDGGVYTPISDAAWAVLTTEAMCFYNDDETNGGYFGNCTTTTTTIPVTTTTTTIA